MSMRTWTWILDGRDVGRSESGTGWVNAYIRICRCKKKNRLHALDGRKSRIQSLLGAVRKKEAAD
jgi:hypothetical protein